MWRTVASVLAGVIAWGVIVTLINLGLRAAIPGYHAAEATLQFTAAMNAGRLTEAALSSVCAGAIAALAGSSRKWVAPAAGLLILLMFLPIHIGLWSRLPVWYHLAFLVPIVPLFALGGRLARRRVGGDL